MPTPETGRQRALRIPLDYFKRPGPLDSAKLALSGLALVITCGWLAWGWAQGPAGDLRYSRGPVAQVHQAWDARCEACHVDYVPIAKGNWLLPATAPVAGRQTRCEFCHAGPVHHKSQRDESTPACGSCHREHRGRDASLVNGPDSDCVSCHANLGPHRKEGEPIPGDNYAVTAFATEGGHPAFRIHRENLPDPGVIKFNHKLHLAPGLAGAPGGQLECSSCHRPEGADARPPRAAGALMLPVRYEEHCQTCHPLGFDDRNPRYVAPHRAQPAELLELVRRTYADEYLRGNLALLQKPVSPTRPLPGKTGDPEMIRAQAAIDRKVKLALETLFLGKKTCGECHLFEGKLDEEHYPGIPGTVVAGPVCDARWKDWLHLDRSIPEVWLPHARFSHAAHRASECQSCHASLTNSETQRDVGIPDIATCRRCHAPSGFQNGQPVGGARYDCAECHRYHNGDQFWQGLGAEARSPAHRLDTGSFLEGVSGK